MTAHELMATWLEYFSPTIKAAGKQFDKDMEAASLALALDNAGFDTFNEAERYELFLAVDDRVRQLAKPPAALRSLREKLLPVYSARHRR